MATSLRNREAIESIGYALVGALGVVLGLRTIAPNPPKMPTEAPHVEPPPGGWPALPTTSDRVVKYVLEAKLDPETHLVEGKETITLRNTSSAPLSDLRLHLYLNAFKNDRTLFRRARVSGFRGEHEGEAGFVDVLKLAKIGDDGVATDLWPSHEFVAHTGEYPQDPLEKDAKSPVAGAALDETDVRVPLGEQTVAPGATATFEVQFRDQLPEITERTGYHDRYHFVGQWFPKLAKLNDDGSWAAFPFHHVAEFYADYGSYDVTIDVPASYVIGATGPRVDGKVEGGRRVERHVIDDVHDFAWTAWNEYVVREEQEGHVRLHFLSPPGYESAVEREVLSVRWTLRALGARFGEYPYDDLTVVHPPEGAEEAGGMEYPTLITTGGPWWPAHGTNEVEGVTVHELGHQWFYGLIGTNEVEWPAGDEGFNSWEELGVMEGLFGKGTATSIGDFTLDWLSFARRGTDPNFDEPVFQPAYDFANGAAYGGRVYGATSTILETLHRSYGAKFDTAMGVYTRRYRFAHPTPEQWLAVIKQIAGDDCAAAARAALFEPGSLDFYVEQLVTAKRASPNGYFDGEKGREKKTTNEKENEKANLGWTNVTWIGRRGAEVDLPVEVELRFKDGTRRREIVRFGPFAPSHHPGSGVWRRIDADGPSELVSVVVDPDLKIPMDRTRNDNFRSNAAGAGGAPVTRERMTAWIEILARSVGP